MQKNDFDSSYLVDMLFVQAATLHEKLLAEDLNIENDIDSFYSHVDLVLKNISVKPTIDNTKNSTSSLPAKIRKDDFSLIDAESALRDWSDLFPVKIWSWYVISGTFLGLVREGGFLAHDYDLDLGFNAEDCDIDALLNKLSNSPQFYIESQDWMDTIKRDAKGSYSFDRIRVLVKVVHKSGISIDVFVHYLDVAENKRWHGSRIHRWDNSRFDLQQYTLAGIKVLGPADADRYLTENYGEWRIPVKDFNCSTGTPNLVIVRNFLSQALFIKRLVALVDTNKEEAEKLKNTLCASGVLEEDCSGNLTMAHYV